MPSYTTIIASILLIAMLLIAVDGSITLSGVLPWSTERIPSPPSLDDLSDAVVAKLIASTDRVVRKVYYINLPKHVKRRERFDQLIRENHWNVPIERVEGRNLSSIRQWTEHRPSFACNSFPSHRPYSYRFQSPEQLLPIGSVERFVISVYASHITVFEKALEEFPDGTGVIVSMEDDTILQRDFETNLISLLALVPDDWQLLRITWAELRPGDRVADTPIYRATKPFILNGGAIHFYGGAHFCIVRVRAIPALLDYLDHAPLTHVDEMMVEFPTLRSYAIHQNEEAAWSVASLNSGGVERTSNPGNGGQ